MALSPASRRTPSIRCSLTAAKEEKVIREYAKASLVKLIEDRLAETHPGLQLMQTGKLDPVRKSRIAAGEKRGFLERVLQTAGPETLLTIGDGFGKARLDPVWMAAISSSTPAVLFDKWRRFEAYAHWNNRLRIEHAGANKAEFFRYAKNGEPPTQAENLMVCGLMTGLLKAIGCRGLHCTMISAAGSEHPVFDRGQLNVPLNWQGLDTSTWRLSWLPFQEQQTVSPLLELRGHLIEGANLQGVLARAAQLLLQDASRQWAVGELASAIAMSERSLQRKLRQADLSFSQLVRLVRVHEACRLLESTELPLTVIGFSSGFSDSAHFSRDFKAATGMPPRQYRALAG